MKTIKTTLALIGFIALILALLSIFMGLEIPIDSLLGLVGGFGYLLLAVVAAVGLVLALIYGYTGRVSKISQFQTPDAEGVETVPAPGDDLDKLIEECGNTFAARSDDREEIRRRLREATESVLVRQRNYTRNEAINRIEDGTWTDDRYASTYLREKGATIPSIGARFWNKIWFNSWLETCVKHTVAELKKLEVEGDD